MFYINHSNIGYTPEPVGRVCYPTQIQSIVCSCVTTSINSILMKVLDSFMHKYTKMYKIDFSEIYFKVAFRMCWKILVFCQYKYWCNPQYFCNISLNTNIPTLNINVLFESTYVSLVKLLLMLSNFFLNSRLIFIRNCHVFELESNFLLSSA